MTKSEISNQNSDIIDQLLRLDPDNEKRYCLLPSGILELLESKGIPESHIQKQIYFIEMLYEWELDHEEEYMHLLSTKLVRKFNSRYKKDIISPLLDMKIVQSDESYRVNFKSIGYKIHEDWSNQTPCLVENAFKKKIGNRKHNGRRRKWTEHEKALLKNLGELRINPSAERTFYERARKLSLPQ
jgi:hypothetical protein